MTAFWLTLAGSMAGGRLAAMFQGSNSPMRLMGWSAMRVSTSRSRLPDQVR